MDKRLEISLKWLCQQAPKDEDWWIIGSTAARLVGADLSPEDVDVVASAFVIERITGVAAQGRCRNLELRFHSDPFFRLEPKGGLALEFMGDLCVGQVGAQQPLKIRTRRKIDLPFGTVYVPEIREQITIFETFGRPKDLARSRCVLMESRICSKPLFMPHVFRKSGVHFYA